MGETDDDILGARAVGIRPIAITQAVRQPQALDFHVEHATSAGESPRPFHAAVSTITRLADLLTILETS